MTVRSKEADEYKRIAAHAAVRGGVKEHTGPVSVSLTLHPKTTKSGQPSKTRMDLDNCIKVTLDALNGVAYRDDRQVVRLLAEIGAAIPMGGLTVTVEEITQ